MNVVRRFQNPRRFAITPAHRGATAEDDSASEDDGHDERSQRTPQPEATAVTSSATRSKTAVANAEVRQSLFGQLELEPLGEPKQQQPDDIYEGAEEQHEPREQPWENVPGLEQHTPEVGFYYTLYSEGERASSGADSDDDNGDNDKDNHNNVLLISAPAPEDGGKTVASVVRSVSAAIEEAKSKATGSTKPETRAVTRKQNEHVAEEQQRRQEKRIGRERKGKHVERDGGEAAQKSGNVPLPLQNARADAHQQGQIAAVVEGREEEASNAVDDDSEIQMEVPKRRRKLPVRQGSLATSSRRLQRQMSAQPPDDAHHGTEERYRNNKEDDSYQDSEADSDSDHHLSRSTRSVPSRNSKPTKAVPKWVAKRKRAQSRPAIEEANPDVVQEGETGRKTTETKITSSEPSAAPMTFFRAKELILPNTSGAQSKRVPVSTKTISAIVQLMSRGGWAGMQTWKMYICGSKHNFLPPTSDQARQLCRQLARLMRFYAKVPSVEALGGQQGQIIEHGQPVPVHLRRYIIAIREARLLSCEIDSTVRTICNLTLHPATAREHAFATYTHEPDRIRAQLVEDMLAFVIPHAVAALEAAFAMGGRELDKELGVEGMYVPREKVLLDRVVCSHAHTVAMWLVQLESALAREVGYRSERRFIIGTGYLDDGDDGDNDVYGYGAGQSRQAGGSQARYGRFGRRIQPRPNRPISVRRSLGNGTRATESAYDSTPGAKRRDRSRLKPLLNQLLDGICRARIDIKCCNQAPRASPAPAPAPAQSVPTPSPLTATESAPAPALASTSAPAATTTSAANIDGGNDSAMDSEDDSSWMPIDTAVGELPRPQVQTDEQSQRGELLEIVLPQPTLSRPAPAAQERQNEGAEDENRGKSEDDGNGDGGDDEDDEYEPPANTQLVNSRVKDVMSVNDADVAETHAAANALHADAMHDEVGEPSKASERPERQTTLAAPLRPAQTFLIEMSSSPTSRASSLAPSRVESATSSRSSPVRAFPIAAPLGSFSSPSTSSSRTPDTVAADPTSETRAYTSAELKLILSSLRRLKGAAQLDLVRLAADLGRDVYDVASRAEGIKNVVRATALRQKKPVPRWAQAGYLIR
ncbi:hypothetical protein SEPCBS57363_003937 [Sporothrix epigloea]|uniref:Uncharacterized protein n=1 Tax=Sporothrix epigloea TaxID=1892477 RepID=A0ABP0DPA5_9PEZI